MTTLSQVRQLITEVVIRDKTREGADSAARGFEKLRGAAETSAAGVSKTEKAQVSAARAYETLVRKIDPVARAQATLAKSQGVVQRAFEQGAITAEQQARTLKMLEDRYGANAVKAREAAKGAQGLGTSFASAQTAAYRLQAALAALAGALAVREVVKAADTWTSLQGRLRLVTTDSANLADVQNRLFDIAQDTRTSYESLVELYARVARNTKELGVSQERVLAFTKTLSQAIQISGATAQEAAAGILQFSQAMASGQLRGDELRSVMENMSYVAAVLAKNLGTTVGGLREMAEKGLLGSLKVFEALEKSQEEIDRLFRLLPVTVSQSLTVLNNEFLRFAGRLNESAEFTVAMTNAMNRLRDILNSPDAVRNAAQLMEGFAGAVKIAAAGLEFFARNMDIATVAATGFLGVLSGSFFGPWGAALGLVAGALGGLYLNLESVTVSTTAWKKAVDLARDAHEGAIPILEIIRERTDAVSQADVRAAQAALALATARLTELDALAEQQRALDEIARGNAELFAHGPEVTIELPKQAEGAAERQKLVKDIEELAVFLDRVKRGFIDVKKEAESFGGSSASGGAEKARKTFADITKELERQVELARLTSEERAVQIELDKTAQELKRALTEEEEKQLRVIVERGLAEDKARDIAKQRLEEQRRESERLAKEAADQARKPFETAAEGIQRSFVDAFKGIFDKGLRSFEDFGDAVKQIFINLAAEIAALLVFRPVIGQVLGSIGLGGISSQLGAGGAAGSFSSLGQLLGLSGAGPGAAGGGGFSLGNLGSLLDLGGIDILGSVGSFLGLGGAGGIHSGIATSAAGGFSALGALGSGFSGFGIGSLLSSLGIGKPLGSSIGGAIGGIVGSIIPGIGTILGSLAGGLLGGLFGSKPTNATARLDYDASGNATLKPFDKMTQQTRDAIYQADDAIRKITDALRQAGATFTDRLELIAIGQRDPSYAQFESGLLLRPAVGDVKALVEAVVKQLASTADYKSPTVQQVVDNSNFKDLDALLKGIEVALTIDGLKNTAKSVSEVEKALADIEAQFDELRIEAEKYGISLTAVNAAQAEAVKALKDEFSKNVTTAILAFTGETADGVKQTYQDLLAAQAQRVKDAKALSASLADVERLNGLERLAFLRQLSAEQRAAIEATLDAADRARLAVVASQTAAAEELVRLGAAVETAIRQQTALADAYRRSGADLEAYRLSLLTSDLSPLSPEQKLLQARSQFSTASEAAYGGDLTAAGNLPGLAQTLLDLSRGYFASSSGYGTDFSYVTDTLEGLGISFTAAATQAEAQAALLQQELAVMTEMRDEIALVAPGLGNLSAQLAELTALSGGITIQEASIAALSERLAAYFAAANAPAPAPSSGSGSGNNNPGGGNNNNNNNAGGNGAQGGSDPAAQELARQARREARRARRTAAGANA